MYFKTNWTHIDFR